eukprot:1732663-Pleurochrysis_carterae.AAC.1
MPAHQVDVQLSAAATMLSRGSAPQFWHQSNTISACILRHFRVPVFKTMSPIVSVEQRKTLHRIHEDRLRIVALAGC